MRLTEQEVEARNSEFRIGQWEDDFACVFLYRGKLDFDDQDRGLMGVGDALVVEVYDRADTSIWFEITMDQAKAIAEMFSSS